MSNYQVTARKWRPQDFSQLVGQEHVTTALSNAIHSGKVPHAYLFSGPRGVGKTSTARILAKLLTCVESPNICGICSACQEITLGQSLDVREIDGASNRGIEQIREIRDNVLYTPLTLKYKIFIIDEVHMLTKEASNALLKVLEEPPEHIIFMLATTEANKILPTIRSRCQHYLLKRIPLETLVNQLAFILDNEGYPYEREALEEIAQSGDGSMRDSQTILDQVILYSEGNLTLQATREVLGIPESLYFETIITALVGQDIITMLEQLDKYLREAGDGISFAEHFTKFLRKMLLIKKLPANHSLLEVGIEKYELIQGMIADFDENDLITLLNLSLELYDTLRQERSERFWIESTLFKMLDYKNRLSLSELRQEIFKALGRNTKVQNSELSNPLEQKRNFASQLEEHQNILKTQSIPQNTNKVSVQANMEEQRIEKPIEQKKDDDLGDTIEEVVKNLFEIS
ncbi:MAG: DNA polymerase III subunit gamma/tau [Brevinema sp.]